MYSPLELFKNYWLMSAVSGWLAAQILKIFTGIFHVRKFSIRAVLFGTGGMPSSHTAAVTALCTSIAVTEGFASLPFAISGLFCIIVMTDATGVRMETGKQSKALNLILKDLFDEDKQRPEELTNHFRELIGHTPLQVVCGALVGVAVGILLHFIPVFSAPVV